ncbi:MAG: dynamin family protein [Xanthobacteraceae bacterium]
MTSSEAEAGAATARGQRPDVGIRLKKRRTLDSDTLLSGIKQAAAIVASSIEPDAPLAARLAALADRLQQQRLQIAVLGQFKRGKSTFVNALLGAAVLPTGALPLTAIPTFISWHEEPSVLVRYADGRQSEQLNAKGADEIRATLFRFVTEEANPKNRLGVERVELFYPSAILAGGNVLIDTPGIGSTLTHNTEAALQILPECDASLFIVSADPPITEVELSYLRRLKPKIGHTFFVINKIDYVTADEQRAVSGFMYKTLADDALIEPGAPIFGVSARLGLAARQAENAHAWTESGMAEIERKFSHYLATKKTQSLREAIARKALDIVAQADSEVDLRKRVLEIPVEQLQRKLSEFASVLVSIESQRVTIGDFLSGERRRLTGELETQVQKLRRDTLGHLTSAIDNLDRLEDDGAWEEEIKSSVSTTIQTVFGAAQEKFVDAFSHRVGDSLFNHWHRLDALTDEVRQTAAKMFNVQFAAQTEPDAFRLAHEPYWVTERIAATLIPDFSRAIDRLLPRALRRNRRRSRIVVEANELIVRNAESLRWAVMRGLDETFRAASGQLDERFVDAIATTKGVMEDALAQRSDQAFLIGPARDQLSQSKQALAAARSVIIDSGRQGRAESGVP